MPIAGIAQPEVIVVDGALRLRRFDGNYDFALEWYQDEEVVWLVDGVKNRYTMERLDAMYRYLDRYGELYFIEYEGKPIGDVCFWKDDLPIVIGDSAWRGRGIGRKVIAALIDRGRELGYNELRVGEIYDFNPASRKCFERLGFRAYEKTEKGNRFALQMGDQNS